MGRSADTEAKPADSRAHRSKDGSTGFPHALRDNVVRRMHYCLCRSSG